MRKLVVCGVIVALVVVGGLVVYLVNNQAEPEEASTIVAEDEHTLTYVDALGNRVVVDKSPERTIFLYNSALDLWYLSGGTAVGRVEGSTNVPAAAEEVELVGSMSNPNLEKIIALEPDLVVLFPMMSKQRELKKPLDEANIDNIFVHYENYHGFLAVLRFFTKVQEHEDLYKERAALIEEKVDRVLAGCPEQGLPPRVLILFATANGMSCELPGSHVGTMVDMLGAENVVATEQDEEATRVQYSIEEIYQQDPDLILININGHTAEQRAKLKADFTSDPIWGKLRAVKEEGVHVLPQEYFLYKPNEKYPEAFQYLARLLYPRVFK